MQASRSERDLGLGEEQETEELEPAGHHEDRLWTIGDLARDFGISLRALRFYEDRGLLRPRRRGAVRCYSDGDRDRLRMILRAKQLGFTLTEIHDMLAARPPDATTPGLELTLPPDQIVAQISHLERRRQELDRAILDLRASHRRLTERGSRSLSN
jgi:DNA-binding transcriptional MerR regulator